jgi:hypothetical protein
MGRKEIKLPFKSKQTNTCDKIKMSEKEGVSRIYRRTVGGISQTIAIKSQMRPLRTKITSVNLEHHSEIRLREPQPPHLFPENAFQTITVPCSKTYAEQANEHDEK